MDSTETTLHLFTKAFNSTARLVSGTHKFSRLPPTFISLHRLPLRKRSVFKICTLMFKLKSNPSLNYLADLFKFPFRRGLRSSTYSHFLEYLPIVLMLNLNFPTVTPFMRTLFSQSYLFSSLLCSRKALKMVLFKQFVAEHFWTVCNQRNTND